MEMPVWACWWQSNMPKWACLTVTNMKCPTQPDQTCPQGHFVPFLLLWIIHYCAGQTSEWNSWPKLGTMFWSFKDAGTVPGSRTQFLGLGSRTPFLTASPRTWTCWYLDTYYGRDNVILRQISGYEFYEKHLFAKCLCSSPYYTYCRTFPWSPLEFFLLDLLLIYS